MALIIEQQPLYNSTISAMPVGQPVIFDIDISPIYIYI